MAHATVTAMTERESIADFCDALKRMASCAREMAALKDDKEWAATAQMLDDLRQSGYQLSRMRAMKRSEVMEAIHLKQHPVNFNPLKKQ